MSLYTAPTEELLIMALSSPSERSVQQCLFSLGCPLIQESTTMTQNEIEGVGRLTPGRIRVWTGESAGITKGWLLLSIILAWVFMGCAIFAAVSTVQLSNRVTEERIISAIETQIVTCQHTNTVRSESRLIALADILEDRRIWTSIDALLDGGIPEPARSVVFNGLDAREERVDGTYVQTDCSNIGSETP